VGRQRRSDSLSSPGDESDEWAQYLSSMETGEGNTELGQRRAGDSSEEGVADGGAGKTRLQLGQHLTGAWAASCG
jgi:hypothetical protein